MKPDVEKMPPPLNSSEMIGPISMPAIAPIPAAAANDAIVILRTSIPISAAAA